MDRTDDLLDEPLYVNGTLIRRWAEFALLPRPDASGAPRRTVRRGWLGVPADVPTPRMPRTLRWESEPAGD